MLSVTTWSYGCLLHQYSQCTSQHGQWQSTVLDYACWLCFLLTALSHNCLDSWVFGVSFLRALIPVYFMVNVGWQFLSYLMHWDTSVHFMLLNSSNSPCTHLINFLPCWQTKRLLYLKTLVLMQMIWPEISRCIYYVNWCILLMFCS